jgi:hypothetical protein
MKLYKIFGWTLFKELGADISVRNSLQLYHVYVLLLKLDVFFFFGFDLQFLILVLISQDTDMTNLMIHAALAIPLSVIVLTIAYYGVREENRILTYSTWVGLIGAIVYLLIRLVDIFTTTQKNKYLSSKNSLTFFEILTVLLCLITLAFSILNFLQYGNGLKEKCKFFFQC